MIVVKTRQRLTEKAQVARRHRLRHADRHGDRAAGRARQALLDDWITEEELWACTSCRACVDECPVSIDQLDIINELRRDLVLMESRFPEEAQGAHESLERNGSPWAFSPPTAPVGRRDGHPHHGRTRARGSARHPVLGGVHGLLR
jgi:Fe-S oxidoreductase